MNQTFDPAAAEALCERVEGYEPKATKGPWKSVKGWGGYSLEGPAREDLGYLNPTDGGDEPTTYPDKENSEFCGQRSPRPPRRRRPPPRRPRGTAGAARRAGRAPVASAGAEDAVNLRRTPAPAVAPGASGGTAESPEAK